MENGDGGWQEDEWRKVTIDMFGFWTKMDQHRLWKIGISKLSMNGKKANSSIRLTNSGFIP